MYKPSINLTIGNIFSSRTWILQNHPPFSQGQKNGGTYQKRLHEVQPPGGDDANVVDGGSLQKQVQHGVYYDHGVLVVHKYYITVRHTHVCFRIIYVNLMSSNALAVAKDG